MLSLRNTASRWGRGVASVVLVGGLLAGAPALTAADPAETAKETARAGLPTEDPARRSKLVRLAPDQQVWIDPQRKQVIVGGEVCLREGPLEMFACPRGTK